MMLIAEISSSIRCVRLSFIISMLVLGACSSKEGYFYKVSDDVSPLQAAVTAEYERVELQDYEIERLRPYGVKTESGAEIFIMYRQTINGKQKYCSLLLNKGKNFQKIKVYSTSSDEMEAVYCYLFSLKRFRPSAYKRILYDPKLSSPALRTKMASLGKK